MTIGLIHVLWVRSATGFWHIVPLINKRSTVILELISVWRSGPEAHENDAFSVAQPKVHSTLQIYSNRGAHLHVGKDIAGLEDSRQDLAL